MTPALVQRLSKKYGHELASLDQTQIRSLYAFKDLPSFLSIYYRLSALLRDEDDFYQLAYAYLKRAAEDNVVYAEIFFDLQVHMKRGVEADHIFSGLHRAKAKAEEDFGIRSAYILCFDRCDSEEKAFAVYEVALDYRDQILGFGLDSDGYKNPPSKFKRLFSQIKQDGFPITMHAELDQHDIHTQIDECIHMIGVDRIDHGVNSADESALSTALINKDIGLTVCPLSTFSINRSFTLDKIRLLVDRSVRVTVHSDDPAYFDGYINSNMMVLVLSNMFKAREVLKMIEDSFIISWLEHHEKQHYLSQVRAYAREVGIS